MSRYKEFTAWNRMPEGEIRVDAPDGTVSLGPKCEIRSTMYDNLDHPLIQSGDFQNPHIRYGRGEAPATRNRNGR